MKNFNTSDITFKYEFEAGLGPWEEGRYNREFLMNIFYEDEYPENEEVKLIGKVKFYIIYIDQAINDGYDLMEIFDHFEYTFRHGQDFFDFDTEEIKEDIQEFYSYAIEGSNICLLEDIEIIPEFRGNKLAAKAIKDIVFHFSAGCCLFVIQPYPLQFDAHKRSEDWDEQLKLNDLSTDEEASIKKLKKYYKSIGFDQIKGYKDLLFYNPARKNERMDGIDLEESR
ncbi:MAG TPA: hypothetical protein VFG54_06640 [Prolixibacteraceae bacterium]|nr:hypothetical protein [Prolixibacteraceae bacterium]